MIIMEFGREVNLGIGGSLEGIADRGFAVVGADRQGVVRGPRFAAAVSPSAATTMAASWETQELVEIPVGQDDLLQRRLLVPDMESGAIEILELR